MDYKGDNKMKKIIIVIISSILMAMFLSSCINWDTDKKITEIDEELKDNLSSNYSLTLPDTVEFIEGKYTSGLDPTIELYFRVKSSEFEEIFGDGWEKCENTEYQFGRGFYEPYIGRKVVRYYTLTTEEFTHLFYHEDNNSIECVFVGNKK